MFTAVIVVKCWVGNTKERMRRPRSTRKENSFLKSQKLLWRTGSIPFCTFVPQSIHFIYDVDLFMLWDVHNVQEVLIFTYFGFVIAYPISLYFLML